MRSFVFSFTKGFTLVVAMKYKFNTKSNRIKEYFPLKCLLCFNFVSTTFIIPHFFGKTRNRQDVSKLARLFLFKILSVGKTSLCVLMHSRKYKVRCLLLLQLNSLGCCATIYKINITIPYDIIEISQNKFYTFHKKEPC